MLKSGQNPKESTVVGTILEVKAPDDFGNRKYFSLLMVPDGLKPRKAGVDMSASETRRK
jgi:hypothetical protein